MNKNDLYFGGFELDQPESFYRKHFRELISKLKGFDDPINKLRYIEYFINNNPWIKVYLFGESYEGNSDEMIIRSESEDSTQASFYSIKENGLKRIDKTIKKTGGIITYLKMQYSIRYNDYINKKDKRIDDFEKPLVHFLGQLIETVEEIEQVELRHTQKKTKNKKQENQSTDYTDNNYLMGELKWLSTREELVRHLVKLEKSGIISLGEESPEEIIKGKYKPVVLADSPYVEILALFQFWENNGFIGRSKTPNKRILNTFTSKTGDFMSDTMRRIRSDNYIDDINTGTKKFDHPRVDEFGKILNN